MPSKGISLATPLYTAGLRGYYPINRYRIATTINANQGSLFKNQ